jgi:uncharacterized protein (DUF1330 family)
MGSARGSPTPVGGERLSQQEECRAAYIIAQINVTDPEKYGNTPGSLGLPAKHHGWFLARGGQDHFERHPPADRKTEFPDVEAASAYHSVEHRPRENPRGDLSGDRGGARSSPAAGSGLDMSTPGWLFAESVGCSRPGGRQAHR